MDKRMCFVLLLLKFRFVFVYGDADIQKNNLQAVSARFDIRKNGIKDNKSHEVFTVNNEDTVEYLLDVENENNEKTYRISYDDDKTGYEDFNDDSNKKYSKFLVNSSENGEEFVITLEKGLKNARISLVEDKENLKSEDMEHDYFINENSNRANIANKKNIAGSSNAKNYKRKDKKKTNDIQKVLTEQGISLGSREASSKDKRLSSTDQNVTDFNVLNNMGEKNQRKTFDLIEEKYNVLRKHKTKASAKDKPLSNDSQNFFPRNEIKENTKSNTINKKTKYSAFHLKTKNISNILPEDTPNISAGKLGKYFIFQKQLLEEKAIPEIQKDASIHSKFIENQFSNNYHKDKKHIVFFTRV